MNLNELPDMSDALKQVQMYEKKKLDPVGKEDDDIDNDGDVDSSDKYLKNRRKAIGKAIKKEEVEVEEGYKGKHGQSDKEYAASRSQGGKMISGDDKMSGAEYTHGRRVKAANPGMQPDVGGKTKPKSQGKMDKGTRADLMYRKANLKKEAFAFSNAELEELALYGEEIDALTDQQLEDFFIEAILEMAEDDQDLIEICEHLESVEMLTEEERDAGAMARAKLNKPAGPSRMDRLKSAAKKAGSKLKAGAMKAGAAAKKGIKAAGKSAAKNAGKAVGEFQAARIKQKRAAMSRPTKQSSSSDSKSSSSDDDGTGGKLDALLAKTRGTSSSSNSSGGGSSSGGSSSGGSAPAKKKKGPGLLRKVGSAVKKGLKKAVGKTARVVSKGSGALAKRLGEDYETIAHLHESGLFSMEEIEAVVLESEKNIRGYDSEEQKKRLEKKRGMKLDDHPQFKKENK